MARKFLFDKDDEKEEEWDCVVVGADQNVQVWVWRLVISRIGDICSNSMFTVF